MLQGARLSAMTQKLAYNWITKLKGLKPITNKGQENLKDTIDALEEAGSPRPTELKLWKDLKHPKIRRNIRDWMWKLMHNRLRSGVYWENIPGYSERTDCQYCLNLETMDHILFSCTIEGGERYGRWRRSCMECP